MAQGFDTMNHDLPSDILLRKMAKEAERDYRLWIASAILCSSVSRTWNVYTLIIEIPRLGCQSVMSVARETKTAQSTFHVEFDQPVAYNHARAVLLLYVISWLINPSALIFQHVQSVQHMALARRSADLGRAGLRRKATSTIWSTD